MLKGKAKAARYDRSNKYNLLNFHASMFEYNNLPDTVNTTYLERFLQYEEGTAALLKDDSGDLIACAATLGGTPLDVYGESTEVIAVTRNGKEYRRTRDKDCIFIWNNSTHTPCMDILTDASRITEIDISIDFLIFWTRISNLIETKDDKTKQLITDAFTAFKAGSPLSVTSAPLLEDFINKPTINILPLTQPDLADKIQFTAKLREDIERWHFTRYGQAQQNNSKTAQQSVEEVDGDTSTSFILPYDMSRERNKALSKAPTIFPDLFASAPTCRLSPPWQAEIERYLAQNEVMAEDNAGATAGATEGAKEGAQEEEKEGKEDE